MTILYGAPADPVAFRRYYEETHIPIARKMKGLTGWNLSWIDPAPSNDDGAASRYILVAELYAESAEAMKSIMASPEGVRANQDLENFVTGSVEFLTGDELEVTLV
ncbi:EthD family reductase [Frondihabitans sucicola]|nr:EthD family reductase [Frondihabitans sucicola]